MTDAKIKNKGKAPFLNNRKMFSERELFCMKKERKLTFVGEFVCIFFISFVLG